MQRPRRWLAAAALGFAGLASEASAAELAVEWAPLQGGVDTYQVERRLDEPGERFVALARVPGARTRFVDDRVQHGRRYCYRIRGVRGDRLSPPSPPLCSVAAQAPPAPAPEPAEPTPDAVEPSLATAAPAQPESVAAREPPPSEPAAAPQPSEPEPGNAPQAADDAVDTRPPLLVDRDVKALRRPPPVYPRAAVLREQEGWVKLRFTVTAAGRTRDIQVLSAQPPGVFEQAAIDAVARFEYLPRLERGVPVDRPLVETEVSFVLIQTGGDLITGRRGGPR